MKLFFLAMMAMSLLFGNLTGSAHARGPHYTSNYTSNCSSVSWLDCLGSGSEDFVKERAFLRLRMISQETDVLPMGIIDHLAKDVHLGFCEARMGRCAYGFITPTDAERMEAVRILKKYAPVFLAEIGHTRGYGEEGARAIKEDPRWKLLESIMECGNIVDAKIKENCFVEQKQARVPYSPKKHVPWFEETTPDPEYCIQLSEKVVTRGDFLSHSRDMKGRVKGCANILDNPPAKQALQDHVNKLFVMLQRPSHYDGAMDLKEYYDDLVYYGEKYDIIPGKSLAELRDTFKESLRLAMMDDIRKIRSSSGTNKQLYYMSLKESLEISFKKGVPISLKDIGLTNSDFSNLSKMAEK